VNLHKLKKETDLEYSAGLEGIIAGKSAICTVGRSGDDLRYRGYSVTELCQENIPADEVAFMLIYDRKASAGELETWREKTMAARELPAELVTTLKLIPAESTPMDVLRTGWSFLGNIFPEEPSNADAITRLIGSGPSIIATWYNFHRNQDTLSDYPHPDQ
jgi:2-methylcitrate synthase